MLKSWMLIALITFLVALGGFILRPKDVKWFSQLRRPKWLVFEPAIPIIWTVIFICGGWSANLVWQQDSGSLQTSLILFLYLLLEIIIVAFAPVTLWSENLNKGTIVGVTGIVLGVILISIVSSISSAAALLLLPYLLWSPIGAYTTWEMSNLNPKSAKQPT